MYGRKLLKSIRSKKKRSLDIFTSQKIYGSRSHLIATLLVLLACLFATGLSWYSARNSTKDTFNKSAEQAINSSEQEIGNRLNLYGTVLTGSRGLFMASQTVSRSEWGTYINNFSIEQQFPGVQAYGYAAYVPARQKAAYEATIRKTGINDFSIKPVISGNQPSVPILYVAPFNKQRQAIIGFNMYSQEPRRSAIVIALDSGKPALTGKVMLVSDKTGTVTNQEPGLIMFTPVYNPKMEIKTIAQRRAAIQGFTYVTMRVNELMGGIYGNDGNKSIGLAVYNGDQKTDENVLYKSDNYDSIYASSKKIIEEKSITISDNKWILSHVVSASILSGAERDNAWSALIRGVALSLAVSILVYYLLTNRARKIMETKHLEVQSAKDDLLSLASHQLRTPATVVKQYVGMLLEGYAGKLSKQQTSMLESAYSSNERQLHIINQILYVARLDAGQIKLHKERININKMLVSVVTDHQATAEDCKLSLVTRLPKKSVYMRADKQYLYMALDNLISNACKYTPHKGKVIIGIKQSGNDILISVKDTGVGIIPSEMNAIFEKFTRGSNDLISQVNGSGIGLYLVKKITELHHGTVIVSANKPNGTIFTLRLPQRLSKIL